jgi:hypothetical protein
MLAMNLSGSWRRTRLEKYATRILRFLGAGQRNAISELI